MSGVLFALLLLSVANDPGVEQSDQVRTYPIRGASAPQLWQQMRLMGPPDAPAGKRYSAWTHWNVSWHYGYRTNTAGCHIGRSSVSLATTINLPAWVDEASGPAPLQAEWDLFIARLKLHESGHRDNGLRAAEAIREFIDNVGASASCAELGRRVDAYAHARVAEANLADVDYDAATEHGRKQGAVLP